PIHPSGTCQRHERHAHRCEFRSTRSMLECSQSGGPPSPGLLLLLGRSHAVNVNGSLFRLVFGGGALRVPSLRSCRQVSMSDWLSSSPLSSTYAAAPLPSSAWRRLAWPRRGRSFGAERGSRRTT